MVTNGAAAADINGKQWGANRFAPANFCRRLEDAGAKLNAQGKKKLEEKPETHLFYFPLYLYSEEAWTFALSQSLYFLLHASKFKIVTFGSAALPLLMRLLL